MGESRRQRAARFEKETSELLGLVSSSGTAAKGLTSTTQAGEPGPGAGRTSRQAPAGEGMRAGDSDIARVLEAALRHSERNERYTHGFHSYPAALHPDAARDLLSLGEGKVLDPFCGGGTVPLEAMAAGREALGCDLGAVPCLVARARTAKTDEAGRTSLRTRARAAAEIALRGGEPPEDAPPDVRRAYEPHVAGELQAIRQAIGNDPLLKAVFSAIAIKVSRRASDTHQELVEDERPVGTTATLFHKKAREFARMLEAIEVLPGSARIHREDARELRLDGYGLVITSPPYPGVYDYAPIQGLRRYWLGLDDTHTLRDEIGSRRAFRAGRAEALTEWKADTSKWIKAAARSLVPGGRLCVIVGDGQVGARRIDSWTIHDEAARAQGLRWLSRSSVQRWDAGFDSVRWEHAGVWEKPT
ncbi:MAG: hypothetical protein EXR69_09980 [Myxococcales bacterium]|nr:hypothetical protein [Myxococcales bacterium]